MSRTPAKAKRKTKAKAARPTKSTRSRSPKAASKSKSSKPKSSKSKTVKSKAVKAAASKSVAKPAQGRKPRATPAEPIALYYWGTPNGWKITIMLEECRLPYTVHPVDIARGEQFAPDFLAISPNKPHSSDRRSAGTGRAAGLGVRVRRDPAVSRP